MSLSQKERLLDHLKSGKPITRLTALVDLGIFELSARVCQLEKDGFIINKRKLNVFNRFGEKIRVIEYSLGVINER